METLTTYAPAFFALATVIILALIAWGLYRVWGEICRRAQIRDLRRELEHAVEAYRPPRRPTARCHCGRFSRRIAAGHGWEEIECTRHGHDWRIEKLVGEFERPFDAVTVTTHEPILLETILTVDTATIDVVPVGVDPPVSHDAYGAFGVLTAA